MKLHELFRLNEGVTHTVQKVSSPDDLRDADGNFLSGTVNVAGSVDLSGLKLEWLPVRFGTISGDFDCSKNRLTSLEGAPGSVGGYFDCSNNQLTSLEGAPGSISRGFYCHENQLTTLEGAPGSVGRDFDCSGNRLTSLEGAHRILRRVGDGLHIWGNGIVTGGIGLILVEGLTKIDADQPALRIINKYLGQGMKGVLRCQEELHEAGFEEFAKL